MQLLVTTETRFYQNEEGVVYSDLGDSGYSFWARYLHVFDSVCVLGRLTQEKGMMTAPLTGPGVSFYPLPGYLGPAQFLLHANKVAKEIRQAGSGQTAVIIRSPSIIAALLARNMYKTGRPFGVEVIGDPYDVFAPGAIRHPLRAFFRWWFTRELKRQCKQAAASSYVTESALQKRYPANAGAYTTHYSSIELRDEAFAAGPRIDFADRPLRLVTVGTFEQLYKGQDVLLHAFAQCLRLGANLTLTFVGDGRYRHEMEQKAQHLGVATRVGFLGKLPAGKEVRDRLDKSDLFVLPSITEGLPRAMIEAMARALPCIGSTVGGIPELLSPEFLVPPGDAEQLTAKIMELIEAPDRLREMSVCNWQNAREYHADILHQRRVGFYQHVRRQTEMYFMRERINGR